MILCKFCLQPFTQESFEVFCSPDCTIAGNSRRPGEISTRVDGPQQPKPHIPESEESFDNRFVEYLNLRKWKSYHTKDSRKSKKGFPDRTCWRERVVFVELKKEDGVLSADQATVIEELRDAGAEVHVFRPSDWDEIVRIFE